MELNIHTHTKLHNMKCRVARLDAENSCAGIEIQDSVRM